MHSLRNRFLALLASVVSSISCGGHGIESPADFIEQGRVEEFLALFGTVNADEGYNIIQTSDDGLLIAGNGNGTIAPADGTISNGNLQWRSNFSTDGYATANSVISGGEYDAFLLIVDNNGDFVDQ